MSRIEQQRRMCPDGCGYEAEHCGCDLPIPTSRRQLRELRASIVREVAASAREKARLMRVTNRLPKLSAAEWLDHFASDLESGLLYATLSCGKCRTLGSIGPCDEHGPLGTP
jgi:hypothetical protein